MALTDIMEGLKCPYCQSTDLSRLRGINYCTHNKWIILCNSCKGRFRV